MAYKYFSRNGQILTSDEATIPLNDVAYSYGYGVYETIRVTKGKIHFVDEHTKRLIESAAIIGLEHNFTEQIVAEEIDKLVNKNQVDACNIKVLLVGGRTVADANLYVACLNPLFPDRKLYRDGVHCITYKYVRDFPHAKTLNMLPSYLAYRDASKVGAYEALLIDRSGNIIEGTRTNFFALQDKKIYTPKESDILLGVTRNNVLEAARDNGFEIIEQDMKLSEIKQYESVFITSTSTKIMPIKSIDELSWELPNENLTELMRAYDKAFD